MWFDEYICQNCDSSSKSNDYINGEIMYSLRCYFLHEGNPTVSRELIDEFRLIIEKPKPNGWYSGSGKVTTYDKDGNITGTYLAINVRHICTLVCNYAELYYKQNKSKFSFNYRILDYDEYLEKQLLSGKMTEDFIEKMYSEAP